MYGVGAIIFWGVSALVGLASLIAVGRRLAVRVFVVCGLALFILSALPAFDDPDPVVRWLIALPLIVLAMLAIAIIAIGPKPAQTRPPQS